MDEGESSYRGTASLAQHVSKQPSQRDDLEKEIGAVSGHWWQIEITLGPNLEEVLICHHCYTGGRRHHSLGTH